MLVEHPDEQFGVASATAAHRDRRDVLGVQHEAVFLEGAVDHADPFHLALPRRQLAVVRAVDLHAVAALLLRHVAGGVGRTHDFGQRVEPAAEIDEADARPDAERPVVPDEVEFDDRLAQLVGDAERVFLRAVLEEHAELVATEAGERVALAQQLLEQHAHLPHELVASGVAARVVHDLELVEVEVQHGVMPAVVVRALDRDLEAALELAAVDEAGQRIVARVVRELRGVLAFLADVVEHRHDAGDLAVAVADRRCGFVDSDFAAVVADQQDLRGFLDGAAFAEDAAHEIRRDLAGRLVDERRDRLQ